MTWTVAALFSCGDIGVTSNPLPLKLKSYWGLYFLVTFEGKICTFIFENTRAKYFWPELKKSNIVIILLFFLVKESFSEDYGTHIGWAGTSGSYIFFKLPLQAFLWRGAKWALAIICSLPPHCNALVTSIDNFGIRPMSLCIACLYALPVYAKKSNQVLLH